MRPTLRYNSNKNWRSPGSVNLEMIGIIDLIRWLNDYFVYGNRCMLEIGSYMGESTSLFASTHLFNEIHVLDPHEGVEEFNDLFDWTWEDVKKEWKINTRHWQDIIHLHNEYSYNMVDSFPNQSFDFIYVDGNHSYEGVKQDLIDYLPKVANGGVLAGHDYHPVWPGVVDAVHEILGEPDATFADGSWVKIIT